MHFCEKKESRFSRTLTKLWGPGLEGAPPQHGGAAGLHRFGNGHHLLLALHRAGARHQGQIAAAYADINQQQLGDRLHMVYEIPDVDFPIPLLTIQPIVENAILHGIKPKVGGGTVSLKLEELPDHWQVTVTDDGVGFGLEAVREKGSIGLENVRRRIARFPGSELRITSTVGMGTQAVLTYGKRGKNMENLSKST